MKKIYLTPEIKSVTVAMQLLTPASMMDFRKKPEPDEDEDEEVSDFDKLL